MYACLLALWKGEKRFILDIPFVIVIDNWSRSQETTKINDLFII